MPPGKGTQAIKEKKGGGFKALPFHKLALLWLDILTVVQRLSGRAT